MARRANVPIQYVDAESPAILVWDSLLAEARKRNLLPAIRDVVYRDFPLDGVAHAFGELERPDLTRAARATAPP